MHVKSSQNHDCLAEERLVNCGSERQWLILVRLKLKLKGI